jgi:hypothetical protein
MKREQVIQNLREVCTNYAKAKEYKDLVTYRELMDFLTVKFYKMKKFKNAWAQHNCKNCRGRGFIVQSEGERLRPCTCLKGLDDG